MARIILPSSRGSWGLRLTRQRIRGAARKRQLSLRARKPRRRKAAPGPPADVAYPFPPISLFAEPTAVDDSAARNTIERNARAIERRLGSFRIGAKVVGVSQGPAVTQYEVALVEGVKVSRVVSFFRQAAFPENGHSLWQKASVFRVRFRPQAAVRLAGIHCC